MGTPAAAPGGGLLPRLAAEHNLGEVGGRTVVEAIAAGVPFKDIWRAAWAALDLPPTER